MCKSVKRHLNFPVSFWKSLTVSFPERQALLRRPFLTVPQNKASESSKLRDMWALPKKLLPFPKCDRSPVHELWNQEIECRGRTNGFVNTFFNSDLDFPGFPSSLYSLNSGTSESSGGLGENHRWQGHFPCVISAGVRWR